jgi:hypothetical protein
MPLQKNLWVKQCRDSGETFGSTALPVRAFGVDTIGGKRAAILILPQRAQRRVAPATQKGMGICFVTWELFLGIKTRN